MGLRARSVRLIVLLGGLDNEVACLFSYGRWCLCSQVLSPVLGLGGRLQRIRAPMLRKNKYKNGHFCAATQHIQVCLLDLTGEVIEVLCSMSMRLSALCYSHHGSVAMPSSGTMFSCKHIISTFTWME